MEGGSDFLSYENISLVTVLVIALLSGWRGYWVPRWTVDQMRDSYEERIKFEREEKEHYRDLYIESLRTNQRAIDAVADTVQKISS